MVERSHVVEIYNVDFRLLRGCVFWYTLSKIIIFSNTHDPMIIWADWIKCYIRGINICLNVQQLKNLFVVH